MTKNIILLFMILASSLSYSKCNIQLETLVKSALKFDVDFYYTSEYQGNSVYKATIFNEKHVENVLLVELLTGRVYSVFHPYLDTQLITEVGEPIMLYKDEKQICEE